MKNDNPQSSEPLDGESDSQAIRNLVQILKPSAAAVALPAPVIRSFNPESTLSGRKTPGILFSVFM